MSSQPSEAADASQQPEDADTMLDRMSEKILSDQLAAYESGLTGQGETHQRAPRNDPSYSVMPMRFTSRDITWESGSCELSARVRRRIPAQFDTDFLNCKVCRSLSVEGWKDQLRATPDDDDLRYERERGHYTILIKDMETTWKTCTICAILRGIPLPFGKEYKDLDNPEIIEYIKVLPGFGGNGQIDIVKDWIAGEDKGSSGILQKQICYQNEDAGLFSLKLDVRPYVWPWLPAEDAAKQIKEWLTKCREDHTDCARQSEVNSSTLPSRLVDMGYKEGDPNKIISYPADGLVEYIALSYCWGDSGSLKLTAATEAIFSDDVPWSEMPPSWQDAIEVAGELGIRYLWIDALCIKQDDPADWAAESAKMGRIYHNAAFTISADAASGDKGFLKVRDMPCRWIDLPKDLRPAGFEGYLTVCEQSDGGFEDSVHDLFWTSRWGYNGEKADEAQNHTFHRGWCLQERYLATRVVHITSSEMFWECREKTWCECGFSPMDRSPRKREFWKSRTGIFSRDTREWDVHDLDPWWELVREYTERGLTFDSDRLIAISGLAKEFKTTDLGEYMAGIWQTTLPGSLLWWIWDGRRTTTFVGPTWSWASVVGQVSSTGLRRYHSLVDGEDIECYFDDADPFASVKGGYLQIRAPVVRGATFIRRSQNQTDYKNREIFDRTIKPTNESITVESVVLDFAPSSGLLASISDAAACASSTTPNGTNSVTSFQKPWYTVPGVRHRSQLAAIDTFPQEGEFEQEVVILILVHSGQSSKIPTTGTIENLAGLMLIESEVWPGAMERIGEVSKISMPVEMMERSREVITLR